jgi:hypothetical protein
VHRVRAIDVQLSDDILHTIELESEYVLEEPSCLQNPSCFGLWDDDPHTLAFVRVGHCRLKARNHHSHVGNIAWDRVEMPRSEVKRMLRYLLEKRGWSLNYGPEKSDLYPGGDFTLANRIADAAVLQRRTA